MDLERIQKAYFVGVGGIGVSAILRLLAARGVAVTGSDIHLPPRETLPQGTYFEGTNAEHVPHDAGVLIYSPAVPKENPERVRARELGIHELSYPLALARVTAHHRTIAVSGTHGKSTTTALLGKLFEAGGLDPSVIVGAEVSGFDHNLRIGRSDLFVVEACEYRRNMMELSPQTILLTNLELDHPDYYLDLADIKNAFRDYIEKVGNEGLLVINNDDANIRDIIRGFKGAVLAYGVGDGADLVARNVKDGGTEQSFELIWKGDTLGTFTTTLPGLYNIYNILAATSAYLAHGGNPEAIQGVLGGFHGIGRRFEVLGSLGGAAIIADYAHHPTALRALTEAALARYKGKRLLVVFRPHHRERTNALFDQFVETIALIPHMILVEIYDVAGREEALQVSSKDLVSKALAQNPSLDLSYAADLSEAEAMTRHRAEDFDVIFVVGAGDADELAKNLVAGH